MNLIEFVAKWAPKDISKHNEFLSDTLELAEEAMFQITKPILPVKPCGIGKKKKMERVVALYREGHSAQEVAGICGISERTVYRYLSATNGSL